jgi:hypothetical protein
MARNQLNEHALVLMDWPAVAEAILGVIYELLWLRAV